jgi:hypothetical protein
MAKEIKCERMGQSYDISSKSWISTCFIDKTTTIDSMNDTVLESEIYNTSVLSFYGNMRISYLPNTISKAFSKLEFYDASYCSIKALSKNNFLGLNMVSYLGLKRNKIQEIYSDTFEDLKYLKKLELGKNY